MPLSSIGLAYLGRSIAERDKVRFGSETVVSDIPRDFCLGNLLCWPDRLLPATSGHWNFVCIIELPCFVRNEFGYCRRMVKKSFFQKQSIGLAALASTRDWAIVSGVVLGVLGLAEAALVWSHIDKDVLQITLIGAFAGMLPSVLMCLPVYGIVDELSRDALESFLRSIKFVRYSERNETRFCTQNTPTWMRWDSNRVTIRPLSNGQLSVTMPLYCYQILKQRK